MINYNLAELTIRENLLIVLLSTIVNPKWNDKPWKDQYEVFRMMQALHAPGKFSDDEIKDLVDSIMATYKSIAGTVDYMLAKK